MKNKVILVEIKEKNLIQVSVNLSENKNVFNICGLESRGNGMGLILQ
jgi:glutamate formiminotransferase